MNETKNDVVEKIRKLLALGERAGSKEEAELAMVRAQEFAIRHQIDIASIKVNEPQEQYEEKCVVGQDVKKGRKSICQKFITWILQNNFNVSVIYRGSRWSGQKIVFIGKTSDIQVAEYIQGFLSREMVELWNDYRIKTDSPVSVRNSFLYGLYYGIQEKLNESKKNIVKERINELECQYGKEIAQETETNYWLTVKTDSEKLEEAVQKKCPKLKYVKTSIGHIHSFGAIEDGRNVGRKINLRPAVTGGTISPCLT